MALFDRINRFANTVGDLLNDDARGRLDLAEALLARGDPDAALHELRAVLDKRRDHARAQHLVGLCYLLRDQLHPSARDRDEALQALQQALAVNPDAAGVHESLGEAHERRGEEDEAVQSYRQALARAGATEGALRAGLWRRLGRLYLQRGRLDKAVRELRKAVAQEPEDAEAQGLLGQALVQSAWRKGELGSGPTHEAAQLSLSRAAKSERPEPKALAALGTVLLSAGQIADAEKALQRALEVAPEEPAVVLGVAQLRLLQGALDQAQAQARRALVLLGEAPPAQDDSVRGERGAASPPASQSSEAAPQTARGEAESQPGRDEQAPQPARGERSAAKANQPPSAERTAQQAEAWALLARCLERSGAVPEALRAYQRALGRLRSTAGSGAEASEARGGGLEAERPRELGMSALRLALAAGRFSEAAALAEDTGLGLCDTAEGLAARAQDPERCSRDARGALALALRALEAGETLEARLAEARLRLLVDPGDTAAAAAALRRAAALACAHRGASADAGPSERPGPLGGGPDPRPRAELAALYRRERGALPPSLYGLLVATQRHLLRCPELAELAAETAGLLATLDRPLLVTVMGEFNAGKSTFVNALLGEEVAPMGITPTTATINVLKYGRTRGGRVVYRDDTSREVAWEEVPALLRAVDEDEARRIRVVEVLYPLEVLQQVNVVDTPGLNSILAEHEATAREFIAQADAVVWLFTVDQAGKASEREALTAIHAEGRRILGVLNKIDRLGPGALAIAQTAAQQAEAAALAEPALGPAHEEPVEPPATTDAARDSLAVVPDPVRGEPVEPPPAAPEEPGAAQLREILLHLYAPESGLRDLLETIIPFSGRDALLGRRDGDEARQARSNLPALNRTLEERFFARSKSLKEATVRTRLLALLRRARALAARGQHEPPEELSQALRLCQADAVLFQRDFLPSERRRLIAAADAVHQLAARETVDFVRPRRWPFGENEASPADRDFLVGLLEDRLSGLVQACRGRVVAELRLSEEDTLRLLDEQVYGRYRAFSRGYLRGGKVDEFFVRVLPRLELSEAAVQRALEKDAPTALDMLEGELLAPLARFAERHFQRRQQRLQQQVDEAELARFDLEERVIAPLHALLAALGEP